MATYGTLNIENITSSTGGVISPNITSLRNRIINGAGTISQYNGSTATTNTAGSYYFMDRWLVYDGSGGSHFSVGQNKGGVTPPTGFTNYIGINVTSAVSASASNNFSLQQQIEGFNIADLAWGTASAKTVTLSFWVYCSLTGTFGGSLRDNGADYFYPFSFSVPVANTWTQISITITGATGGTWVTNNGRGIGVLFDLGLGSSFQGTGGAWTTNSYYTVTGATPLVGTNGANYYITGVQLEVGAQATSFDYRQYGTELMLCQRYLPAFTAGGASAATLGVGFSGSATQYYAQVNFPVTPRVAPTGVVVNNASYFTVNPFGTGGGTASAVTFSSASSQLGRVILTSSSLTVNQGGDWYINNTAGNIYFTGCEL